MSLNVSNRTISIRVSKKQLSLSQFPLTKLNAVSMKFPYHFFFTLTLIAFSINTAHANPDIKDEAIKVLINFKTKCNLESLSREVTEDNGLKFTAQCSDATFYPDGLTVLCPVRDVDVSCKIMTEPREFRFLNLIYGPMGERTQAAEGNDIE